MSRPWWDGARCLPCPTATPVWYEQKCQTCYDVDPTRPKWSGIGCEACPQDKPCYFRGDYECHEKCPDSAPSFDSNKVCNTCAESCQYLIYWHPYKKECVQICETGVTWDRLSCQKCAA